MPRERVVIAQAEPEMLDAMKAQLEQAGYDAVAVLDGVRLYEALEGGEPGAVILDLDLSGVSGFRLVKLIRRNPRWRRLPLIVASSYAFEEVEDLASEGIDGFVRRPFDPAHLVSQLELALSRARGVAA